MGKLHQSIDENYFPITKNTAIAREIINNLQEQ